MKHRSPKNSCGLTLCNFLATGNLLKRAGSKLFVEVLAMVISYYNSAIYLNIRTAKSDTAILTRPPLFYIPRYRQLLISFETHCIVCFGNSPNYNTSCVLGEQYLISKWTNGSKQRNSRINFKSNKTTAKLTRSF